jgi:hypothetical protein
MSKMAELDYDIEQLYIEGFDAKSIAVQLGCPIEIVLGSFAEMGVADAGPAISEGELVFASMVKDLQAV